MVYIDDTYNDNEIECPYCGAIFSDSWEYGGGEEDIGEIECGCGKKFLAQRNISISYTTNRDCEINNEEHKFIDWDYKPETMSVCSECGKIKNKGNVICNT